MKIVKAFLFILATVIMIACLFFVPGASGAVALTYLTVLSLYLGLDVAEMIVSTSKLKAGEYKEMQVHKYVITGVCLLACIAVTGFLWRPELQGTMTTFLSAVMVILACAIGGLEGNKIATKFEADE